MTDTIHEKHKHAAEFYIRNPTEKEVFSQLSTSETRQLMDILYREHLETVELTYSVGGKVEILTDRIEGWEVAEVEYSGLEIEIILVRSDTEED